LCLVFLDLLIVVCLSLLYNLTDAVKFDVDYRFVNRLPIHHLKGFILVIEFVARVKTPYFVGWLYVENYNGFIEIQVTFFGL